MLIFYSGSDNHVAVVPETVLKRERANVMLTYAELRRCPKGNSRFRRHARQRGRKK